MAELVKKKKKRETIAQVVPKPTSLLAQSSIS